MVRKTFDINLNEKGGAQGLKQAIGSTGAPLKLSHHTSPVVGPLAKITLLLYPLLDIGYVRN
jgi:hypothetical protein